jgi:hypothetical protein
VRTQVRSARLAARRRSTSAGVRSSPVVASCTPVSSRRGGRALCRRCSMRFHCSSLMWTVVTMPQGYATVQHESGRVTCASTAPNLKPPLIVQLRTRPSRKKTVETSSACGGLLPFRWPQCCFSRSGGRLRCGPRAIAARPVVRRRICRVGPCPLRRRASAALLPIHHRFGKRSRDSEVWAGTSAKTVDGTDEFEQRRS